MGDSKADLAIRNETPHQRMWRHGRVPNEPILRMVEEYIKDDGLTELHLEQAVGVSKGYFRLTKKRGIQTMDFRIADRILTAIDCTTRWWDEDLVEHYLNVNLDVQPPKQPKPGICRRGYCFEPRRAEDNYCCDEHREQHREQRRAYKRSVAERKRAEQEAA